MSTVATRPTTKPYFRTTRAKGYLQGADRKQNIIRGAKLIEAGPLNDSRPWEVDSETLAQVIELGSQRKKGLKARFAHPNMSDDGLGTFVGNWRRLRIIEPAEGDPAVIGDLHLAQSSFNTPKGNLGKYLLDMAEQDPEEFGTSLATQLADEMFGSPDPDDPDEWIDPEPNENGLIPLRFESIHAADFVDEPAATRGGLFSAVDFNDSRDLAPFFDWILQNHFAKLSPEQILEKARVYLERHYGRPLMSTTIATKPATEPKAILTADPPAQPPETSPPAEPPPAQGNTDDTVAIDEHQGQASKAPAAPNPVTEAQPFREAFGDQGFVWFCEGYSFQEAAALHRAAQDARIADLEKRLAETEAQLAEMMGHTAPIALGKPKTDPARKDNDGQGSLRSAIRPAGGQS